MSRPAYMIIAIDVRDPSRMAEYAGGTQPLLEAAGARVLAATNGITVEDGTWPRERIAILEFPSMESARSWISPFSVAQIWKVISEIAISPSTRWL